MHCRFVCQQCTFQRKDKHPIRWPTFLASYHFSHHSQRFSRENVSLEKLPNELLTEGWKPDTPGLPLRKPSLSLLPQGLARARRKERKRPAKHTAVSAASARARGVGVPRACPWLMLGGAPRCHGE